MILIVVSKEDHSNNDCLLVTVISFGEKGGIISSADKSYNVKELWENFVGDNCKTLIGKPKLFFIQASRGTILDYGVSLNPKHISLKKSNNGDEVNDQLKDLTIVIPGTADLLIMYSTTDGHSSFRSGTDGSWFIQALCEELKINQQDDLLTILTRVNKRVSYVKRSNTPGNAELNVGTQMANIESTLTKSIFLKPDNSSIVSDFNYNFTNTKRGIALIFNHESFDDKSRRLGAKTDGVDLKAVLEGLKFDVMHYMDLKLHEIKKVLDEGKTFKI